MREWRLQGALEPEGPIWQTRIRPLPFQIGRLPRAGLTLVSSNVSLEHAELFERDGELWLRDLGSTNGTFVNGEPVRSERCLREGDLLHFADLDFKLIEHVENERTTASEGTLQMQRTVPGMPPRMIRGVKELLDSVEGAVTVAYQEIVTPTTGRVVGYEALGRATADDLPQNPNELLDLADRLDLLPETIGALRRKALLDAPRFPLTPDGGQPALFLNSHPREVESPVALYEDLRKFREDQPTIPLVVEIHETAIGRGAAFDHFRQQLDDLGAQQAFDDFGSGVDRLRELCERSPHIVKFDQHFARDLAHGSKQRSLLTALLDTMAAFGIKTLLEGIETQDEALECGSLGFDFAQGYFWGRPRSLEDMIREARAPRTD